MGPICLGGIVGDVRCWRWKLFLCDVGILYCSLGYLRHNLGDTQAGCGGYSHSRC